MSNGKVTQAEYTIEELVAGITEENRHAEINFGIVSGKEITWYAEELFLEHDLRETEA